MTEDQKLLQKVKADLDRRREIWADMIDNWLSKPEDYPERRSRAYAFAKKWRKKGYTLEDIEAIYRYEVFPGMDSYQKITLPLRQRHKPGPDPILYSPRAVIRHILKTLERPDHCQKVRNEAQPFGLRSREDWGFVKQNFRDLDWFEQKAPPGTPLSRIDRLKQTIHQDLKRRREAWEIISWLWLDNGDFEDEGHSEFVARELFKLGYNLEELDGIYQNELLPHLFINCFSVAGAWSGFDIEYTEMRLLIKLRRHFHFVRSKLNRLMFGWFSERNWRAIKSAYLQLQAEQKPKKKRTKSKRK